MSDKRKVRPGRRRVSAATLSLAAAATALAVSAAPAAAAASAGSITACQRYAQNSVTSGKYVYDIWTDAFGGNPECLTESVTLPAFTISSSFTKTPVRGVQAYPHISVSNFRPTELSKVGGEATTWSTTQQTTDGRTAVDAWAADTDDWITRTRTATTPRAELLIWLNRKGPAGFYKTPVHNPVYRIDGANWYLVTWAPSGKRTWTYIQFRRVRPATSARAMAMAPFIRAAEKAGLLKPWWWQQSIEAGFEIWSGGRGLAVRSFSASLSPAEISPVPVAAAGRWNESLP